LKRSSKDSRPGTDKRVYIVPAVDKAFRILSLLRNEGREMSTLEIAEATGLNNSSVHKLAVALNYHGALERNKANKKYSLGIALVEYGQSALNNISARQTAKSFLRELVEYSGESAAFSILHGTKMVIVDVEESKAVLRVSPIVGMVAPATTTSNGKAVLAWLAESQVAEIIQKEGLPALTEKSVTEPKAFLAELATVRKRGYATDCEEYNEKLHAVSAPVFKSADEVMGAISITGPSFRVTQQNIRRFGKKCVETASRLSANLR
jgi:DNA-binding IclR family transcriptional regulator